MIYRQKPENFNPKFDVVSCFVETNGEILLLHRQDHKPEGNTWGVPAGKVDSGEENLDTMIREIKEETGIQLTSSQISYFEKVFVRYPQYDFIYHIYHTKLCQKQKIVISPNEHKDFKWVSPKNALSMNLITDEDSCIKLFYKI